ncbi:MAG: tetratricopeptide repeat protein [Syntrophobacteraceae bacterium]|nr:tetratricopeptide repeat protein [Syntrophobacteraceae bacterium]
MNKLKTLVAILLAVLILAGIGTDPCAAADRDGSQTKIIRLLYRIKGHQTCLTFDAEGPKPTRIGPVSDCGISVFFSQMAVAVADKSFTGTKTAVKEVKFRRGSDFFEVLFRWANTKATYNVRPGRHGRYVLTMILTPPAVKNSVTGDSDAQKPTDFIVKSVGAIAPPVQINTVKTSELFGAGASARAATALAKRLKSAKAVESAQAPKPASSPFVEPDQNGLALYAGANRKFEDCSRNLAFCASDIITAYRKALKAGPRSSQAPLALYRSGLAYYTMGKYRVADQFFKTVTSQWADSPAASRCWIGSGNICIKRESYIEAMESYRWALRQASAKEDKAAAEYVLGKTYQVLGAHKEALQMLQDCLAREPGYYHKNPLVLRFIGEAEFDLGDFRNAKQMLLRYVNCQESDPDQGTVLAKIGEILLNDKQVEAARKTYGFVHKYYTNSEGDIIGQIRSAELMEKFDLGKAIEMYNTLRARDLSPSFRNVVTLKLAELELKKCDLEQGLTLMDKSFPIKGDGGAPPEIGSLRESFFRNLVRQYYSNSDFDKTIRLVDKYRAIFNSMNSPETLEEVAESYAARKSYYNALQTYDRLLAQQHGANLDGILLNCGVYALRLRDFGRASRYAQAAQSGALKLKKSELLAQIAYHNEQYAEAVGYFEKVIQQRNDFYLSDPDSYAAFGYSLFQVKKYGEAVPILKKALVRAAADKDTRESVLVTLSDCLKEQKQYDQAAEMLETAIRIAGGEKQNELLYKVSKLYLEAGKSELAVKRLNRMVAAKDGFWSAVAQQELNTINMAAAQTGGNKQ